VANARKGTVVDERYRLDRKIGSGGMADVWLAEDTELDRQVAIKILHDRFAQDKEFVQRFQREAQSAAGLQHPNVVGIFDRGVFRDTYFIAMEYVDGPSLKDLVKGGMGIQDAIDFTRQILGAARFAHRKGIIHRDLKPQNVLIDDEGRARVADFGIARGGENSDITATGSVMGTAQYLSPEQAQGKPTTPRSDIYSIGVILYEALTGRVPFEGDSAVAVALKQVSETPRRPSAINPNIPPALDAVVMRALAKDPEARFKDADAFLRGLDAAERAPDRPRPQDTAAFAAVTPEGETELEDEEEDGYYEPDEEADRRRWRWFALALLAAAVAALVAFALTRPSHVAVPDVIGQNVDVATQALDNKGFDVAIKAVPSGAPRNQVVEQDPIPTDRGGGKAEEGSTVTLSVSSGPAIVSVPDVRGLSVDEATKRLENVGFKVNTRQDFSDSVPKGQVIGTEPATGTQLSTAQPVTLLISRGANNVTVPNVVGLDDQAALNALQKAGLSGVEVQRDSTEPQGKVLSQSPGAGKTVARGSQVTIFASTGAITVPDVTGQDRKAAVTALKKAGFTVAVTEQTTDDPAQVNRVISEFPPGGSRGHRGDTVTISVGVAPGTGTPGSGPGSPVQ
jgi:beta-lactam-binding protein with PASTA domain/predicted Ser/Thr protein kinase